MRRMQGMMLAMAVAALPAGAAAQGEASDDNDRAVHAFLSAVDLGEVHTSALATQRATNAEVRSFAQSMIADHSNALHTREMLMQTENSGLVQRMAHTDGDRAGVMPHSSPAAGGIAGTPNSVNAAAGVPAGGGGNGAEVASGQNAHSSPQATGVAGQVTASGGHAHAGGEGGAHAGHGATAGAAHAGHSNMQGGAMHGMPPGVTPEMVAQVEATLTAHPMSRPVMEANARNLQVLQGVTGPQFDRSYMDAQIGAHRYALSNIDRMLAQTGALGDDIRGTLQQMRTAVAAHLQQAEQIRARLT